VQGTGRKAFAHIYIPSATCNMHSESCQLIAAIVLSKEAAHE
jgi:hypothetical protein